MTQIYSIVFKLSWFLGLLSILAAVIVKLLRAEQSVHVRGGTLFIVAGTFFLCTLATRVMQRAR